MHVLVHDHTNDKLQVANIHRVQCSTNISKCIMLSTGQLIINRFECERVIVLLFFYGCQCLRACESCPGSEDPCDTSNHRERALRGPLHCGIPRLILPTTFLSRF